MVSACSSGIKELVIMGLSTSSLMSTWTQIFVNFLLRGIFKLHKSLCCLNYCRHGVPPKCSLLKSFHTWHHPWVHPCVDQFLTPFRLHPWLFEQQADSWHSKTSLHILFHHLMLQWTNIRRLPYCQKEQWLLPSASSLLVKRYLLHQILFRQ